MDIRSLAFLNKHVDVHDKIFLGLVKLDSRTTTLAAEFIIEYFIKGTGGLFGRGDPVIIAKLGSLISDHDRAATIIDTAVQRIRNWSHLEQLNDAGVGKIEIYEPTSQCQLCKSINGRIVSVPDAYDQLLTLLKQPDPDPSLFYKLSVPPFHDGCRGRFVLATK